MSEPVLRPTPPLPPRLLALAPIVYVGTSTWFAAALVLFLLGTPSIWTWTALSGGGLGIIGALIMLWQQQARRRGSKAAQKLD
ncbi:DUF2530 domain-containing protein [Actinokineospora cianjurensis]|uniref:Uncharacterized protein DUF2530 n=1 Tax=Actinokineospora cianjurensis TaxID=585224 RepID=A0A421B617_9PSEU|nr:DUF2530 domain-containing protein [Actinokineospora cianjurensis]RLK59683.1 uncharacterized protein DUF2530 [Actinokineospora cianjurensis]